MASATEAGRVWAANCIIPAMSPGFQEELRRFGPTAVWVPQDLPFARRYCAKLARSHYENFTVASALLPRRLLKHFHAVYSYCRWADDLADEVGGGSQALQLLRWWRGELLACYEGTPRHPVMIALRETIRRFSIPQAPFLDLLFAFEQDQMVKRYQTHEQLLGYCRNSANPVGRLVLYLCDSFNETNAVLSDHVCTALQLANFWQDVSRDLDIGRVYLPKEDRERFGYTEADLQNRRTNQAFRDLLRFEVDQTKDLFYRGWPLLDRIEPEIRPDIELFIRGGLGILKKIEKLNYDVWTTRPKLAKWEKGALLAGVLWQRLRWSFSAGEHARAVSRKLSTVSTQVNGRAGSA